MSLRSVIFWVGFDVHKDSITAAVFRGRDPEPFRVDRIPNDPKRIRRDAIKSARDFRDDHLVLIHIPTEEDARVRDLVQCRETFQREVIKSRRYILKFLRRRGFIYRDGTHWTTRHMNWIRHILMPDKLPEEDRIVLGEYLALLEYKLQRRDDLDRRIEELALTPRYKPVVDRISCFRGFKTQAAMVLATAVAREMVGFLSAALHDLDTSTLQTPEVTRAA